MKKLIGWFVLLMYALAVVFLPPYSWVFAATATLVLFSTDWKAT